MALLGCTRLQKCGFLKTRSDPPMCAAYAVNLDSLINGVLYLPGIRMLCKLFSTVRLCGRIKNGRVCTASSLSDSATCMRGLDV